MGVLNAMEDPNALNYFVQRDGKQFLVAGQPLYVNGWNSYWLMANSVDENTRPRVDAMLHIGASLGLTVCRTWAFNDDGYQALQTSPGTYDENVFQVRRFTVSCRVILLVVFVGVVFCVSFQFLVKFIPTACLLRSVFAFKSRIELPMHL